MLVRHFEQVKHLPAAPGSDLGGFGTKDGSSQFQFLPVETMDGISAGGVKAQPSALYIVF